MAGAKSTRGEIQMTQKDLTSLGEDIRKIEREYKKIIEPYRSDLWHYCYKLTRSPWDAEDLVQETLLKSIAVLAKIFQTVNTKAYLFKIATNLWIDQQRRSKWSCSSFDENIHHVTTSHDDFQLIENLDLLIKKLTPIQYVSLILTDIFQFKAKEVAEMIGTSEGAIHTNLSRTRSILRNKKFELTSKTPHLQETIPRHHLIDLLLEGLKNKDPELILSILDDHVVTEITHAGLEIGVEETKNNSLKDWKEVVDHQHIIVSDYIELWGRPIVVEFERKADEELYLNNLHYIESYKEKVIFWKFYCFSWDLMNLAAKELDVKLNAAYFYNVY